MSRLAVAGLVLVLVSASGCSCGGGVHTVPDAGGSDASVSPTEPVDPVGTWEQCSRSWTFAADRSVRLVDHRHGCDVHGVWSVEGSEIAVAWDGACGPAPLAASYAAVRSEGSFVLIDRETGSVTTFAREGAVIRQYLLVDDVDPSRRTIVRMAGAPGSMGGQGCYWSEDGDCNGIFSCSGWIPYWPLEDDTPASTSCAGGCPCGAVLDVTANGDGTYAVAYDAVHCSARFMGTATASPR